MKIGVTTNNFDFSCGGMERQAYDIVEGLLARGDAVTVIAMKANLDMPVMKRLDRLVIYDMGWIPNKVRDTIFSWRLNRGRRALGLDALISCNLVDNTDVVVCGGTHAGYLAARGGGTRFYDRLRVVMENGQFSRASRISACSKRIRDEITGLYGVDGAKIHVGYPAVDGARFAPCGAERKAELRARFGFSGDRKTFLFPSYAHARKGLPFLLRFFENTALPVELIIAGRKTADSRNVRAIGPVREIELLYQAADATVMASLYEPFGMVGVESVLCGAPVILAENMGCCEVLDEPAAFKIALDDLPALERAARRIVDGEARSGAELRKCVRYDFSRKAYLDGLMKLVPE